MRETPNARPTEEEQFEHGLAAGRADEAAKPSDIGALDGAAAAGSAANAGTVPDDDGAIPTSPPDPRTGAD